MFLYNSITCSNIEIPYCAFFYLNKRYLNHLRYKPASAGFDFDFCPRYLILLSNITLPRNERGREITKRAMKGISILKQGKKRVEEILGQMEHLFSYYEQARQQTYVQLKEDFEARMANSIIASGYQLGSKGKPNVELLPQFQEEWRRVIGQLNSQYEKVLEEQKRELSDLP